MSKMIRVRIKNNKVIELSKIEKELNSKGIDTDLKVIMKKRKYFRPI